MLEDGEKLPEPGEAKKIKPEDPSGFVSLVYIDLDNLVNRGVIPPPPPSLEGYNSPHHGWRGAM
jgi:hypothetical protein